MGHKVYVGGRPGGPASNDARVLVLEDGAPRPLALRSDLRTYSPQGFEWAYGSNGPAQLALAILADVTGDDAYALRHHHWFKLEVISTLPPTGWKLTERQIMAWTEEHHPLSRRG